MKILLTQLRRIGDVITTTPAVRAVRKAWPNATIDYMTEPPADEIFTHNPYIDNVIAIPRRKSMSEYIRIVKMLRAAKYDVVVDFFSNPTSAYLSFLSGAKLRLGFDVRFRKYFYNHKVYVGNFPPNEYAGIHKLALLGGIGVMHDGYRPDFFIGPEAHAEAEELLKSLGVTASDKFVTLGIVTRHAFRQWPLENFAALADSLIEKYGVKILFIYGPGEEEYANKLRSLMKHKPLDNYPHSGISRMKAVYERAALHIGCDNGPANIAKASGIPNIALFSNARASDWTPPDVSNCIGLEVYLDCKRHCLLEACQHSNCIRMITVERVLAEASAFL